LKNRIKELVKYRRNGLTKTSGEPIFRVLFADVVVVVSIAFDLLAVGQEFRYVN